MALHISPKDYIDSLNKIIGQNLTLDEDGTTQFEYSHRLVLLRFVKEDGVCIVHVHLTRLEQAALPNILGDLLEANFMFSNTQGGSLSWSQETHMAAINFLLPLTDIDQGGFLNRLNNMLAVSDAWVEHIQKINKVAIDTAAKRLSEFRQGTKIYPETVGQNDILENIGSMIQV